MEKLELFGKLQIKMSESNQYYAVIDGMCLTEEIADFLDIYSNGENASKIVKLTIKEVK